MLWKVRKFEWGVGCGWIKYTVLKGACYFSKHDQTPHHPGCVEPFQHQPPLPEPLASPQLSSWEKSCCCHTTITLLHSCTFVTYKSYGAVVNAPTYCYCSHEAVRVRTRKAARIKSGGKWWHLYSHIRLLCKESWWSQDYSACVKKTSLCVLVWVCVCKLIYRTSACNLLLVYLTLFVQN